MSPLKNGFPPSLRACILDSCFEASLHDQSFHQTLVKNILRENLLKENYVKVIPFIRSKFYFIPSYLSDVTSKTNKMAELDLDSEKMF